MWQRQFSSLGRIRALAFAGIFCRRSPVIFGAGANKKCKSSTTKKIGDLGEKRDGFGRLGCQSRRRRKRKQKNGGRSKQVQAGNLGEILLDLAVDLQVSKDITLIDNS